MIIPAHRIALAVGEPHEARLLALIEDASVRVAGRSCTVSVFCSTIRELREAITRTDSVDALVVSSTLQALPPGTLRDLVQTDRSLVLLVPDPTAAHWADIPVPVVGLDTDRPELAAALEDALLGRRPARPQPRQASSAASPRAGRSSRSGTASVQRPARPPRSEVIAVSSAETHDGSTTVAVALAYALSVAAPTALLDVNSRGSAVEFHLPVDPARGLPQLGRRTRIGGVWNPAYEDDQAWQAALGTELQPMGPSGQGWVACGVSTPAYRQHLSDELLERAIATLRSTMRFVVLDSSGGGWSPSDSALDRAALRAADRVLIVLRPDEQGIARTRRLLSDPSNHYRERISLVLNQVGLAGTDEPVGSVEYALGAPVVAVLPFDPHHMAAARAHHRPVICEPGCRLSAPLLSLAGRLAGGGPMRISASLAPNAFAPWWRRMAVGATSVFR